MGGCVAVFDIRCAKTRTHDPATGWLEPNARSSAVAFTCLRHESVFLRDFSPGKPLVQCPVRDRR